MSLYVHRTGDRLLEALKTADGAYYATFARSSLSPDTLRAIDALAREHAHRDVAAQPDLRQAAERLLREFFAVAARSDPGSQFAFSARVLLAVPDYPDLALVLALRALRRAAPDAPVHVLVEDDWQAALVHHEAAGGAPPAFRPGAKRSFARGARSLLRRAFARPPAEACEVVLFTLGENLASHAPDAYFGELAEVLARQSQVLSVYLAPGARVRFPSARSALPLEAFLAPGDLLRAWSRTREPGPPHPAGDTHTVLIAYLRARERACGEAFMQALMAMMFERMLATLKPRALVYPFENRSWEKNLLKAARRANVRCIGYQHSSITPRHLALDENTSGSPADALPDEILTCGEITADLLASRLPQARVRAGAALRARRLDLAPPAQWGLLVPISSSRAEAWEILRVLHALGAEPSMPVIVRTHPTIPIDDLYAQFRWPAHVRLSRGSTLEADLAATSLVAYSSSTVALEGMLYGRLPIFLDIGDIPSGNPIHGEHAFVFRASTGAELRETLGRIRALDSGQLADLREDARAYAGRYLVEPTPARVQDMADAITQC